MLTLWRLPCAAFCADNGGNLEHLYWGAAVPPTDDLRYLSFSNVQLCFDPGPSNYFEDMTAIADLVEDEVEPEDLLKEWDQARKQNTANLGGEAVDCVDGQVDKLHMLTLGDEAIANARRENAAWRLMKMYEMKQKRVEAGEEPGVSVARLLPHSSGFFRVLMLPITAQFLVTYSRHGLMFLQSSSVALFSPVLASSCTDAVSSISNVHFLCCR